MIDEPVSSPVIGGPVCPWCSAQLATADVEHCPSCGAAMTAEQEPVIPGVTTIEPEILARQARAPKPRRGSLISLFIKDENAPVNVEQPTLAELPALARPSLEVRREMIRIELENAGVIPPGDAESDGEGERADDAPRDEKPPDPDAASSDAEPAHEGGGGPETAAP